MIESLILPSAVNIKTHLGLLTLSTRPPTRHYWSPYKSGFSRFLLHLGQSTDLIGLLVLRDQIISYLIWFIGADDL